MFAEERVDPAPGVGRGDRVRADVSDLISGRVSRGPLTASFMKLCPAVG